MSTEIKQEQVKQFTWTAEMWFQMKIARDKRVKEVARDMAFQAMAVATSTPHASFTDLQIPAGISGQAHAICRLLVKEPYDFVACVAPGPSIRFDFTKCPGEKMDREIREAEASWLKMAVKNERTGALVLTDTLPIDAPETDQAMALAKAAIESGDFADIAKQAIEAGIAQGDKDCAAFKAISDAGLLGDIIAVAQSGFETGVKVTKRSKPLSPGDDE